MVFWLAAATCPSFLAPGNPVRYQHWSPVGYSPWEWGGVSHAWSTWQLCLSRRLRLLTCEGLGRERWEAGGTVGLPRSVSRWKGALEAGGHVECWELKLADIQVQEIQVVSPKVPAVLTSFIRPCLTAAFHEADRQLNNP